MDGAFIVQELLATQGNVADGYLIAVGRIDMPDGIWTEFAEGRTAGFVRGVEIVKDAGDDASGAAGDVFHRNSARLAAGLGHHRYSQRLASVDMANVVYLYATLDEQVGRLAGAEVEFLTGRGARIIEPDGGHAIPPAVISDALTRLLENPPEPRTPVADPGPPQTPDSAEPPDGDHSPDGTVAPGGDRSSRDWQQRVAEELQGRSFRQFEPSVDASPRKAIIISFRSGISVWAQYAEDEYALHEWEVLAGGYQVVADDPASEVTLRFVEPRTVQILPRGCDDCVDGSGLSVSIINVLDPDRIAFRLNDPAGTLPAPFPVFDRFRENVTVIASTGWPSGA